MQILGKLETMDTFENKDIQTLQEYIIPKKNRIVSFMEQLHLYRKRIIIAPEEMVLTHGDMWGGNLMMDSSNQLYIIDWESAMIAPREADLRLYMFEDFDSFLGQYLEQTKTTVKLDRNIFGFYAYRSHLANLTNWLFRTLYNNQSHEQNESDFECITVHCMDRWDLLEETMQTFPRVLSSPGSG